MTIVLPTTVSESKLTNPDSIILYGLPKSGKTSFCSTLPNNLIIDLEKGSRHVSALKCEVENFADLTELGREIMKAGRPYKYITIDTITKLEEWCEGDATELYMKSPIGKNFNRYDEGPKAGQLKPNSEWTSVLTLPKGAGYYWLRLSFSTWLDKIKLLAPYIILILISRMFT